MLALLVLCVTVSLPDAMLVATSLGIEIMVALLSVDVVMFKVCVFGCSFHNPVAGSMRLEMFITDPMHVAEPRSIAHTLFVVTHTSCPKSGIAFVDCCRILLSYILYSGPE